MPRSASPSPSRDRKSSRSHRDTDRRDESSSKHSSHRHHHKSRDEEEDEEERRRRKEKERRREKERERERGRGRDQDRSKEKEKKRRSYDSEDDEEDERKHRKKKEKKSKRETSTERAERKAAKKATRINSALEEADAAHRAAAAEVMMYSAEDNPFNDANLGQQFKWGKKEEKEKKMGMTPEEAKRRDEARRREAHEEIARLNIKRAEREKEQLVREEEEARMARLQESAQMSEWVAKEDDFHLEQSRRRAAIRIRENRAKPIDLLAINLKWADPMVGQKKKKTKAKAKGKGKEKEKESRDDQEEGGDENDLENGLETEDEDDDDDGEEEEDDEDEEAGLEIDLEEPYTLFDNLTLAETQELHQDITMYLTLESNEENLDFWRSMIVVCDDALSELKAASGEGGGPTTRLDSSVKNEMNEMLSRKSHEELLTLQDQVRSKLRSGEPVDVEYWEGLLKSIVVWKAKAKLRDLHEVVVSNRLEYLRRKQRREARKQQKELIYQMGMGSAGDSNLNNSNNDDLELDSRNNEDELVRESRMIQEQKELDSTFNEEEMEPKPLDVSNLTYDERHLPIITFEEDRSELISSRRLIVGSTVVAKRNTGNGIDGSGDDGGDPSNALYKAEARKALDAEEETFNRDEGLARQIYAWEDKYRPRKPRYFNRVHTGYEWNKYNQTHYDTENPPPKVVQGYKFNIFYPDLIDKSKAPTYKIIKEPGNDETVILKFIAGAPYEDIAFRIVNKEWVYGHRRGFRSSFDRGILQLYFNFARMRYRK